MEKTNLDNHSKIIYSIQRSHQGKEKEPFEFEEVHTMSILRLFQFHILLYLSLFFHCIFAEKCHIISGGDYFVAGI